MNFLKGGVNITLIMGIISAISIIICHLVLTDIYHAEGDLTLEWNILRIGFLVIILFHVLTFAILVKIKTYLNNK